MQMKMSKIGLKKNKNKKMTHCLSDLELQNLFFPFKILKMARTAVQLYCSLGEQLS